MMITLANKSVEIRLSPRASAALAQRATPLLVEMELLFSCLIRKRVLFYEQGAENGTAVSKALAVSFRPVMTRACSIASLEGSPPLEDFPLKNVQAFVPHWLSLDFRHGQWAGDFGYADTESR